MNVLFQILSTGDIRAELLHVAMVVSKAGANVGIVFGHRGYMANSRNAAINTFLKTNADVLVQCDQDVIPPLNILDILKWRKPIVGTIALCAGEKGPRVNFGALPGLKQTDIFPKPDGESPLVEVAWIGTGCYTITREACETMIAKYDSVFAYDSHPDGSCRTGVDVFMSQRARAVGLPIWIDRSLLCGHNKDMIWAPTKDAGLSILPWGSMWVGDDVPIDGDHRKSLGELLAQMGMNPDAAFSKVFDA